VTSIALTFDDGPDPEGTPRLLAVLDELGARATFFPIAPRAAAHPDLIRRILDRGHTIGIHCHRHIRHSELDRDAVRTDAERALAALRGLGMQPELWRTPYGDVAQWTQEVADELSLRVVGWSIDTHDWRGDGAREMFERAKPGLGDGAVVLAHDGIGPGALRTVIDQTIEFVRLVGSFARGRGLALEALTAEASALDRPELEALR
jgi:peptidoglycan/xylan/chitin deacetylase (PgdA/CDA1 family)